MSSPPSTPEPARIGPRRLPPWGTKVVSLIVATLVLGWGYAWAEPKCYRADTTAGFRFGMVHGALMPAALPCLLVGKDVPIFTANNTGRTYKLGYVLGINFCGVVFFGLAFRPTRRSERVAEAGGEP